MTRLGILVGTRGRGSNMRRLVEACQDGTLSATPVVFLPAPDTPAGQVARELGVATVVAMNLSEAILGADLDLLCLAGYMRLVPPDVLAHLPRRVLNIHPALLPKFGGKGMYGRHVHEAVLAAGETESGATVHYVTERYDEGDIVDQEKCPVLPGDTAESLAERVLACEHRLYPRAVSKVLAGG